MAVCSRGEGMADVVMCEVDESIDRLVQGEKTKVKLEGKMEYCNSGMVEITITRGARPPNIFDFEETEIQEKMGPEGEES